MCLKCFRRKDDADKDVLEQLMGSMNAFQWRATLWCYLVEVFVAWHLLSHGVMVPATTVVYCNTTSRYNDSANEAMTSKELHRLYKEACDVNCSGIAVSKRYYDNTIIHQYHLYCGMRNIFTTLAQMVTMLGVLLGNFTFGFIADSWGRKKTLMLSSLATAPFGVIVALSPNVTCFLMFKFLLNFFLGGAIVTAFVLFSELAGVHWRPIVGLLCQFPFTLSHLSLAGFAYVFRDWRWFQITISLPALLTISYYWVLPESPRWLLAVGKIEEGITQVEKIARYNGLNPEIVRETILKDIDKKTRTVMFPRKAQKGSFKDLFRTGRMCKITSFIFLNWFGIICSYYGIAQYSAGLGTNLYQTVAISAVTHQPSLWLLFLTLECCGRRRSLIFSNTLACIATFCIFFTPPGDFQIIPASVSLFALAMSFPALYVYTGEVFPTPVRNIGMGTCSAIARIGAILAAIVADLRTFTEWLPPVIFSIFLGLAVFGLTFLPETRGIVLPDTIEDVENLRRFRSSVASDSL